MKRLLYTLVASILCFVSAYAYDFSAVCESRQTIYYKIISDTVPYSVWISSEEQYHPYNTHYISGNLIIPESVTHNDTTYSVTGIDKNAFYDCSFLLSVVIPNSVTYIGDFAFYGCTRLRSIELPNSVTNIGDCVFRMCTSIPEPVYNSTYFVYFPDGYATEYAIPEGIQKISPHAFSECNNLTSIRICSSVSSIGEYAFDYCRNLESISVDEGNTVYDSRDICNAIIETSTNTLIVGCRNSFIPNTVTRIKDRAFIGRNGISSIIIPNSVTYIGADAYNECNDLNTVYYQGTLTEWLQISFGNHAISPNHSLYIDNELVTDIVIPNSITEIKNNAFERVTSLTSVTIHNSVTSIGYSAFCYCTGLTSLIIPNSVRTIGNWTFIGCTGLTSVVIGNSLRAIPGWSFKECTNLTSLTVGNSVTSIEFSAFHSCENLRTLVIPNSVTTIEMAAFSSCHRLTTVTLGSNVTRIECYAFYECDMISNVYANPTTPPYIDYFNFNANTTIWVPCGLVAAYTRTDNWDNYHDIRDRQPYILNVTSENYQWGTAGIVQPPDCADGTAIISATPNQHYNFARWTDGNTDNPRTITVTEDTSFTAIFTPDLHTITVMSSDETMGYVTGGGIFEYGAEILIDATPTEGYGFAYWSDGNADYRRMITVTGDATYIANFGILHTITVTSANDDYGTTTGSGIYAEGATIEIEAIPTEHYHFVEWDDSCTDNPRRITITGDAEYIASFAIDQFTITVESADTTKGTTTEGGIFDYGTEIQMEATPNEGFEFSTWNDSNTDNPRTITVTQNATYSAYFIATSVEENATASISLYPNPSNDIITIVSLESISKIELINAAGDVVSQQECHGEVATYNVSDLPDGIYFAKIHVTDGNHIKTLKFVKQN